ncbi:MAG: squalene--hopene cyclase, partial [Methylobacteriaceae bacterium]|nr:squalene--hopene cyclase [Methylobacteriaceae bacterium]
MRIGAARDALLARQSADGHWCFELEADATIPAEYILLRHYLAEQVDAELEGKIARYLRRIQGEHGGWSLFFEGALDLSASVKAYFALKMVGDSPDAPHMVRARRAILDRGGATEVNVFTRIQLALYGELPWNAIPTMPVEMMLQPRWSPTHIDRMSYWARVVLVPLLVLQVIKPRARNPRGIGIAELMLPPDAPRPPKPPSHANPGWAAFFRGLDRILKVVQPYWPSRLRRRAIDKAIAFTTERLNGEDGLGAIYPAMANSVMMFDALAYPADHPDRAIARHAIEKLLIVKEDEAYLQPCVSPIWDTALSAHALAEVGDDRSREAAVAAVEWLRPRQILDTRGDWASERPNVRPGGWAFQYGNAHYPDTDDTAVVLMAMDRLRPALATAGDGPSVDVAIERGREWVAGMQSRNGGWGAFDADNTHFYLNNIPFADHGALLDPPTVDVSARCVGALTQL